MFALVFEILDGAVHCFWGVFSQAKWGSLFIWQLMQTNLLGWDCKRRRPTCGWSIKEACLSERRLWVPPGRQKLSFSSSVATLVVSYVRVVTRGLITLLWGQMQWQGERAEEWGVALSSVPLFNDLEHCHILPPSTASDPGIILEFLWERAPCGMFYFLLRGVPLWGYVANLFTIALSLLETLHFASQLVNLVSSVAHLFPFWRRCQIWFVHRLHVRSFFINSYSWSGVVSSRPANLLKSWMESEQGVTGSRTLFTI